MSPANQLKSEILADIATSGGQNPEQVYLFPEAIEQAAEILRAAKTSMRANKVFHYMHRGEVSEHTAYALRNLAASEGFGFDRWFPSETGVMVSVNIPDLPL